MKHHFPVVLLGCTIPLCIYIEIIFKIFFQFSFYINISLYIYITNKRVAKLVDNILLVYNLSCTYISGTKLEREREREVKAVFLCAKPKRRKSAVDLRTKPNQRKSAVDLRTKPNQRKTAVDLRYKPNQRKAPVFLCAKPNQRKSAVDLLSNPNQGEKSAVFFLFKIK